MPLSSQLVTAHRIYRGPKGSSACHLRGQNPAVSYRLPTPPPHLIQHRRDPMLEQTESSWPGPGLMEPMLPSAPASAPTPSSKPMEESRPSSKPKAKKKKTAAKKAKPKARKKTAKKKKKAGKKSRRR